MVRVGPRLSIQQAAGQGAELYRFSKVVPYETRGLLDDGRDPFIGPNKVSAGQLISEIIKGRRRGRGKRSPGVFHSLGNLIRLPLGKHFWGAVALPSSLWSAARKQR